MKLKSLVIAVIVLAALSGVAYWVNRPPPPPPPDARVGQPLVDRTAIEQAAKLRLTDQGKTVELSRQPDGTWKDDSYFGLPVDFSKLSSFIGDLSSAKIDRLVTSNPERIARLDFSGTEIQLLDASGRPSWTLDLGKNADQGGRFVRYGGEDKAYLASLNAWLDNDAKAWADATLLNLKADDIAKIEVPFDGAAPVTLTRAKKDDAWKADRTPAGRQVSADKVSSLLSSLTSLRFTDSSSPSDPNAVSAEKHERVFHLSTFDGKSYTVALGRKPEEKKLKPISQSPKVDLSYKPGEEKQKAGEPAKPPIPEYDTIPAGPVYAWVRPENPALKDRAFQIDEYTFTSLPQKPDDLFEAAPAAPSAPVAPAKK